MAALRAHLCPAEAADLADRAVEAKQSRLWVGIHCPSENDLAAVGGAMVGRLVVDLARHDGAE